ncbi:growth/differentiation factor 8-like isoform X2 [Lineus longissimus]|uniref:growth/differentiation factor 8-like isoform X2 n=1 Tax=Lineus longissimus TaxID=88925 RepID=UPI00315CC05F
MSQRTFLTRTLVSFLCFSLFSVSSADLNDQALNEDAGYIDEDSGERMGYYSEELSSVGMMDHETLEEKNNSVEMDGGERQGSLPPAAIMRERNKQARLVQIKNQILKKLGIPTKPNFTVSGEVPEGELRRVMARYRETGAEDEAIARPADNMYAMRFNVYTATCDHNRQADREMWDASDSLKYFFDVRYMAQYEKHVTKAMLRLYKYAAPVCHCTGPKRNKLDQGNEDKIRVLIYKYLRPLRTNRRVKRKLIVTKEYERMYEGWVSLNIRNAVQDWLKPQNRNYGIQIVVEDMKGDEQDVFTYFDPHNCTWTNRGLNSTLQPTEKDPNSTLPILEVSSIEVPKDFASRVRDKRGSRSRRLCRRESLYVSFEKLGWDDWIIQPQGFETGYCTGSCARIGWKVDIYRDAWMQRIECCAPSVLKPLKVVHFDQHGKMTFSMFDNFIIADCDCTAGGS